MSAIWSTNHGSIPVAAKHLLDRGPGAQRLLHGDDAAVGRHARELQQSVLVAGLALQWKLLPRFSSERSAFCSAVE